MRILLALFLALPLSLPAAKQRVLGVRGALSPRSLQTGTTQTLRLTLSPLLPPWRLQSVSLQPMDGLVLMPEGDLAQRAGMGLQFNNASRSLSFAARAEVAGPAWIEVHCVLVDAVGQTRAASRRFTITVKKALDSGDARSARVSAVMGRSAIDPDLSPEEREGQRKSVWKEPGPGDYRGNLPP